MRAPALLGQFGHRGAEPRGIELERGQFRRNRRIELHCRSHAGGMECLGMGTVNLVRRCRGQFERGELLLARFHRIECRAQATGLVGQRIDLHRMLACHRAQFEQARLDPVEPLGIVGQRLGGPRELVLGLARLDHCAIERGQRLAQQRMLGSDPVEPPRRAAQARQRRIGSGPQVLEFGKVARQPLALLHVRAGRGEFLLLTHHRRERGQFGQMRQPHVAVV